MKHITKILLVVLSIGMIGCLLYTPDDKVHYEKFKDKKNIKKSKKSSNYKTDRNKYSLTNIDNASNEGYQNHNEDNDSKILFSEVRNEHLEENKTLEKLIHSYIIKNKNCVANDKDKLSNAVQWYLKTKLFAYIKNNKSDLIDLSSNERTVHYNKYLIKVIKKLPSCTNLLEKYLSNHEKHSNHDIDKHHSTPHPTLYDSSDNLPNNIFQSSSKNLDNVPNKIINGKDDCCCRKDYHDLRPPPPIYLPPQKVPKCTPCINKNISKTCKSKPNNKLINQYNLLHPDYHNANKSNCKSKVHKNTPVPNYKKQNCPVPSKTLSPKKQLKYCPTPKIKKIDKIITCPTKKPLPKCVNKKDTSHHSFLKKNDSCKLHDILPHADPPYAISKRPIEKSHKLGKHICPSINLDNKNEDGWMYLPNEYKKNIKNKTPPCEVPNSSFTNGYPSGNLEFDTVKSNKCKKKNIKPPKCKY